MERASPEHPEPIWRKLICLFSGTEHGNWATVRKSRTTPYIIRRCSMRHSRERGGNKTETHSTSSREREKKERLYEFGWWGINHARLEFNAHLKRKEKKGGEGRKSRTFLSTPISIHRRWSAENYREREEGSNSVCARNHEATIEIFIPIRNFTATVLFFFSVCSRNIWEIFSLVFQ